MTLQITGTTVINSGCCLVNIANASSGITSNTYVIRNTDGSICFNNIFTEGSYICGGYLICKSAGLAWIVAPNTTEVSRTWYLRNDAITRAQTVTGYTTGWFVPTCVQIQNPGFNCRGYWDSYSTPYYWSSTEETASTAFLVYVSNGASSSRLKSATYCVRSFRCVTY